MPILGDNPIMNANAIDSGINNSAIVRPERNSFTSYVGYAEAIVFITTNLNI